MLSDHFIQLNLLIRLVDLSIKIDRIGGRKTKIKNAVCSLFMFSTYVFKQFHQEQHPEEQHANSNNNQRGFKHQCWRKKERERQAECNEYNHSENNKP